MKRLIITNGDSVADPLTEAGAADRILAWQDVLHEGPVPITATEAELREIRASFLQSTLSTSDRSVVAELEERDRLIEDHAGFDTIDLWFEHDLYDQLQVLQILTRLNALGRTKNVHLLAVNTHLGPLPIDKLLGLSQNLVELNGSSFTAAADIWTAFRQPTPEGFADPSALPAPALPFVRQALRRALEQLPGVSDGLSRTERQILYSIDRGVARAGLLFARSIAMEEAAFLGDLSFFRILSDLQHCATPLIKGLALSFEPSVLDDGERRKAFIQSHVELTEAGQTVLSAKQDHASLNEIDRWLGGTHLTASNLWRYDQEERQLIAPPSMH